MIVGREATSKKTRYKPTAMGVTFFCQPGFSARESAQGAARSFSPCKTGLPRRLPAGFHGLFFVAKPLANRNAPPSGRASRTGTGLENSRNVREAFP